MCHRRSFDGRFFARRWPPIQTYDPKKGRFRDWLKGILRNKAKDILRKRGAGANGQAVPLDEELEAILAAPAAEEDWDAGWRQTMLAPGLERLRAGHPRVEEHTWQVVSELFVDRRRPAKVMARLGLSEKKVYSVGTEWRELFATAVQAVSRELGEGRP